MRPHSRQTIKFWSPYHLRLPQSALYPQRRYGMEIMSSLDNCATSDGVCMVFFLLHTTLQIMLAAYIAEA